MMQLSSILSDKTGLKKPEQGNALGLCGSMVVVVRELTRCVKASIVQAEERKHSQHMWPKCAVVSYSNIS